MTYLGLILSFLATFALSLYHLTLTGFSKISLSGFLEEKNKPYRQEVLKHHEEIKIAVEFWRTVLLIAFLVYLFLLSPAIVNRPLWMFLEALVVYSFFFEAVPRIVGSAAKNVLLGFFLPSYRLFLFLSAPVLAISRWICGREEQVEVREPERDASDEEIETFIDEAREEGIIEKGEDELLRSVVEFGDRIVREIMTPRLEMVCIRRDASILKLRNLIITEKYSRVPVYKDRLDNIEGVVIAKDLLAYSEKEYENLPIEPLVRQVVFVPESMKVSALLKELKRAKQELAVVVDEHGGVSGLVTIEDIVEEIVGEIRDEYDTEESEILEVAPHEYLVSGSVRVEEIEDIFGEELAEEDFITTSGMITHRLGRLPGKGEVIEMKGLRFEVVEVDQKRIKKLKIARPPRGESRERGEAS